MHSGFKVPGASTVATQVGLGPGKTRETPWQRLQGMGGTGRVLLAPRWEAGLVDRAPGGKTEPGRVAAPP